MPAAVTYLESNEMQKARAFSPAVITEGGKTVWLAGQTTTTDLEGRDISGNFEAQCLTCFALIDKTLKRLGGSLANVVTMTVYINDPRHGDAFVKIRAAQFEPGRYPASALLTVSNFARPGIVLEIQAVAVI
jgi:enamine deaminase RidA (YjgF/YER057c/UK114 family)